MPIPGVSSFGGDIDALEDVVGVVGSERDDVDYFFLCVHRDTEHAEVLLPHAGAARVEDRRTLRTGLRRRVYDRVGHPALHDAGNQDTASVSTTISSRCFMPSLSLFVRG
jgi:hypothetical protein